MDALVEDSCGVSTFVLQKVKRHVTKFTKMSSSAPFHPPCIVNEENILAIRNQRIEILFESNFWHPCLSCTVERNNRSKDGDPYLTNCGLLVRWPAEI
jgi:hypothetical protein